MRRASWSLCFCLMAGCSILGGRPTGEVSENEYFNAERHFSFRVPSGWEAETAKNPFRKPSYLVRVAPVEKDAAAEANVVTLGEKSCFDAVRDSLQASTGAKLGSPAPFTIALAAGEIPAWHAKLEVTDGSRQGRVALFCEGGAAIVLEVSAGREAYARREAELASVIDSFAYRLGKVSVPVAPSPSRPPAVAYFIHEVKWRGQTLGQISRWYTGKYESWKKLAELNGLTVADAPLKVGRQVKIPPELVIRQTPMPKPQAAVKRPEEREAAAETQAASPAAPADESPELPAEAEPQPEKEPPALPPVIGPR